MPDYYNKATMFSRMPLTGSIMLMLLYQQKNKEVKNASKFSLLPVKFSKDETFNL